MPPLPFAPSRNDQRAWWAALRAGHRDRVQALLDQDPRWAGLNEPAHGHWAALHIVLATPDFGSLANRLAMLDAVLPFSNVRWDDAHPGDTTPLMLAARSCQVEVVQRLLERSNPRAASRDGTTALMVAASHGHAEVVGVLLPVSDPHAVDDQGRNAAMQAAYNGRLDALQTLWATTDPAARDRQGNTVAILAAGSGLAPVLDRWLTDPGADLLVRNHRGQGVLDLWQGWIARRASTPRTDPVAHRLLDRLIARHQQQQAGALRDLLDIAGPALPVPVRPLARL